MAAHTPLLSLSQLLILLCWLWGEKQDIFELITADGSLEVAFFCLFSGTDTHVVLGAVTIALGKDFAVKFRVRM